MEKTESSAALRTMRKYLELINSGHFAAIGDLFAENAAFCMANGTTLQGRESIRAFFRDVMSKVKPESRMVRAVADGNCCAFELEGRGTAQPNEPVRSALDFVDVDDKGQITRLVIYTRETAG